MACYYYPAITRTSWTHGYNNIMLWGSSFAIMQTLLNSNGSSRLILHCHSKTVSQHRLESRSGSRSRLPTDKTYWVNMKYDASVAQVTFMAFDPDNSYAQVGPTIQRRIHVQATSSRKLIWAAAIIMEMKP